MVEPRGEDPSKLWVYLSILAWIFPWTISFIAGLIEARRGMVLAVNRAVAGGAKLWRVRMLRHMGRA